MCEKFGNCWDSIVVKRYNIGIQNVQEVPLEDIWIYKRESIFLHNNNNNNNTTVISPFVFYVSLSYLITNPCISFPLNLMTVSHFLWHFPTSYRWYTSNVSTTIWMISGFYFIGIVTTASTIEIIKSMYFYWIQRSQSYV